MVLNTDNRFWCLWQFCCSN